MKPETLYIPMAMLQQQYKSTNMMIMTTLLPVNKESNFDNILHRMISRTSTAVVLRITPLTLLTLELFICYTRFDRNLL